LIQIEGTTPTRTTRLKSPCHRPANRADSGLANCHDKAFDLKRNLRDFTAYRRQPERVRFYGYKTAIDCFMCIFAGI
jgi:hypothetical protein